MENNFDLYELFSTKLPYPETTNLLQDPEIIKNLDINRVKLNVAELYNELVIFVSDVSGETSVKNPSSRKLSRLASCPKVNSYHVPDKSSLTISDLERLVFPSLITPSSSKDLFILLADYHLPFLIGHAIIRRSNAIREKMTYFKINHCDLLEVVSIFIITIFKSVFFVR